VCSVRERGTTVGPGGSTSVEIQSVEGSKDGEETGVDVV
jgi:hypothetical protein